MKPHKDQPPKYAELIKVLPHDLEAEIAILGGCLNYPKYIPKVANLIHPSDFYRSSHAYICQALFELRGDSDVVTVANWLGRKNLLEKAGGPEYITSLVDSMSTGAGYEHHAQILMELSMRRKLIERCRITAEKTYKPTEDLDEILSEHKNSIRQVDEHRVAEYTPNIEIVQNVMKTIENRSSNKNHRVGILTGFKNIDDKIHGLEPKCTYYLAAERSTGKSALALNIAENIAQRNEGYVLYFTLESTKEALTFRRFSRKTGIALTRLRTGNIRSNGEWEDIIRTCNEISDSLLIVIEKSLYQNLEKVASFCESFAMDNTLLLVIIDYLQLMTIRGTYQTEHHKFKTISNRLNFMAKDLGCPLMILSQINEEKKLKESRDIENNADNVWLLERQNQESEDAKLTARKGKDSGTWETWLKFDRFTQRFADCSERYETPTEREERGFSGG